MIVHPLLFFICFIALAYSQPSTYGKACSGSSSNCGTGQTCVNNRCECNPNERRFWAGEQKQCRNCPPGYTRLPERCYKFFSTLKNHSEARADCRQEQADLFSWRDNSDEAILIDAATARWNSGGKQVKELLYSWAGGIISHGRGTKEDYKITWFDPKAPTMVHPDFKNDFNNRYCSRISMYNYDKDPEPTRKTKDSETENCVSYVFVPQPGSQGQICMADDYCSTKMTYICELTQETIDGIYRTAPPPVPPTDASGVQQTFEPFKPTGATQMPDALAGKGGTSSSTVIYIVGLLAIIVIIGIIAFIIIRKRKQKSEATEMTARPSVASSNISDASAYSNA